MATGRCSLADVATIRSMRSFKTVHGLLWLELSPLRFADLDGMAGGDSNSSAHGLNRLLLDYLMGVSCRDLGAIL